MSRDYGAELDALKEQLNDLRLFVSQIAGANRMKTARNAEDSTEISEKSGAVYYSGRFHGDNWSYRWDPQEKSTDQLMDFDSEKAAKMLSALGHRQRIDILRSVLQEPLTGAELVERLNMGTTGQLYHHIKALTGANLLVQEERGGKYTIPGHRALPFLLLLAASSDLLDTSDYMELAEARNEAGTYLGSDFDPYWLLRSVIENSILEHQAGFCSEVTVILQADGSVTVADNGRGIPARALPNGATTQVQSVLTELKGTPSATIFAPNGEKGISLPVVNALSEKLTVEIRREGKIYRQDYRHGIPQSELLTAGITNETGTGVTFLPDRKIFASRFDRNAVAGLISELSEAFPQLSINLL